jgi:hypothetical protein
MLVLIKLEGNVDAAVDAHRVTCINPGGHAAPGFNKVEFEQGEENELALFYTKESIKSLIKRINAARKASGWY